MISKINFLSLLASILMNFYPAILKLILKGESCQVQKKCIQNVAGKGYWAHTDPIFSSLKILKYEDLFKLNCSKFMQSYTRDALPESFKNMSTPLSEPNRTNSFKLDRIKNNSFAHFLTYFLPKVWNSNSLRGCTYIT